MACRSSVGEHVHRPEHDVSDGGNRVVAARDKVGDQAGSPSLVEGADRGAVVAVAQATSVYRKLGVSSHNQAIAEPVSWASEHMTTGFFIP